MPSGEWLTWREFKEQMERSMREKGVEPDEMRIAYIDVQGWNREDMKLRVNRLGNIEVES